MGIRDSLSAVKTGLNIMGAAFSKQPGVVVQQRLQNMFTPIWSQPPKRNTQQWIDLYMKSPRMNPVHKIASDVAATNYKLYVKNSRPKKEIGQHPLLKLLSDPCPEPTMTAYNLFYLTQVYLLLPPGEAFWLIERNGLGIPTEIWIVPPHWVIQVPTKTMPYFRVLPMGNTSYQMLNVLPDDMIWFKEPDPLNPYGRGRGRAEAIGDEIETDEYMAKYSKMFFFNDGKPPVVISAPGADKEDWARVKEDWAAKYGGYQNAHKPALLPWDAKIQILKETTKEMDFVESRKYLRDTTNQFWSIPPELFGILENSNRSTIDAAYYIYTKNILSLRLTAFDDTINKQLSAQFDSKIYIQHDNVVPEDKEFELKRDTEGVKIGAIMVDEWRHNQGMTPFPDEKGQVVYVPMNTYAYPISDKLENVPGMQQEPPQKTFKKQLTANHKEAIWKSADRSAAKYEKKLINSLKTYFKQQEDKIYAGLEKSLSMAYVKAKKDDPEDIIDWEKETSSLVAKLQPVWLATAEEGMQQVNQIYNQEIEFAMIRQDLLEWLKTEGLNRATGINDTTREALRKTLAEGIEAGEGNKQLAERVKTVYSNAKQVRTHLIARTETMTTLNKGIYESLQAAGFEKIEWLSSRDKRVRDSHAKIDGEIRILGEPFSNGLLHPHAEGPAEEVCNCRCTLIAADG